MRSVVAPPVPRIVLVHGWGGSARAWDPFIPLWPKRWSVRAFDLPGCGKRADEGPWTVSHATADLIEVLDHEPAPAILVGHSMGGQVTALLHGTRPDLVRAEVVIDPAYGRPDSAVQDVEAWWHQVLASGTAVVERFMDGAFVERTDAQMRARILDGVAATPPAVLASYLHSEYLADNAVGFETPARDLLRLRTKPTLGIYSTRAGAAFERSAGGAVVDIWANHGHFLHLESPRRFTRTLDDWIATL